MKSKDILPQYANSLELNANPHIVSIFFGHEIRKGEEVNFFSAVTLDFDQVRRLHATFAEILANPPAQSFGVTLRKTARVGHN